jgi:hypothetical protein
MSEYEFEDELLEHAFATVCDNADAVVLYYLKDGHIQSFTYADDDIAWCILLGTALAELDQMSKGNQRADGGEIE